MAVLQNSGARDIRQKFYELLSDFATFPAAQNFFLVNIDSLPSHVLKEDKVNALGIRPGSAVSTGLDIVTKSIFEPFFGGGNNWMFLATGIDLTTETTSVNNRGTLINGILPVGPFMESREYPDNDLDIQFSETNVSIIDSIFRSWIQLYSVYGNIGDPLLSTDISIYFLSKQKSHLKGKPPSTKPIGPGFSTREMFTINSAPVITKIYTYKDCIPYTIKSANVAQYNGDVELGSIAVGFRFSKYDVRVPVLPDAIPGDEVAPERPEYSDDYDGQGFGGNVGAGHRIIGEHGRIHEEVTGLEESRRADEILLRNEIPREALQGESEDGSTYDFTGPQPIYTTPPPVSETPGFDGPTAFVPPKYGFLGSDPADFAANQERNINELELEKKEKVADWERDELIGPTPAAEGPPSPLRDVPDSHPPFVASDAPTQPSWLSAPYSSPLNVIPLSQTPGKKSTKKTTIPDPLPPGIPPGP